MLLCKPFSWTCMFAVMSSDVSQESAQSDVETYSTTPHYSKEDAMRKCHDIVEAIMEFYPSDPVDFCKAIDAAHKNVLALTTTSSVTSALHNFGKTPGMTAFAFRRRNRAAIPVQPTAVARRKVRFGGRRCAISGRPPKSSFAGAHNYAKPSQGVASAFELPRKRARKPHTLSDCVTANMSSAK